MFWREKKNKKMLKRLLWILLISVLILLNRISFYYNLNLLHTIFGSLEKFLWQKGNNAAVFFQCFYKSKNIEQEINFYKEQNILLMSRVNQLSDLEKENTALKEALLLKKEKGVESIPAFIISKEPLEDKIIIDQGAVSGIKKGDVVITSQNVLVGKIERVFPHFSEVSLLTAKNSVFDVKVILNDKKEFLMLARGEGNKKLAYDLLPKEAAVQEGNPVFTVMLGGQYPANLFVGKVAVNEPSAALTFKKGFLAPAFFDFWPNFVLVIKNFPSIK